MKKKIEIVFNVYDKDGNKIADGVDKDTADIIANALNRENKN